MTIRYDLPRRDPRLGRKVHHDPRSRDYAITPAQDLAVLRSVQHIRHVPVFDQGQVGSCTANAALGCLGTGAFYGAVGHKMLGSSATRDETLAVACYSDEQQNLYGRPYPPSDEGGSGLAIAKVLKTRGLIPGYRHAFGLNATLTALARQPVIIGIPWLADMFTPTPDGRLNAAGAVQGGHEIVLDQLDVENQRVWLTNSWGPSWGVRGRAWLTWADLGNLLADQGDCTVLTIPTA